MKSIKTKVSSVFLIMLLVISGIFGGTGLSYIATGEGASEVLADDAVVNDVKPFLDEDAAYLTSLGIASIIDGTEPFDDNSDAGNDENASNNIIRTYDVVTYMVQFANEMEDQFAHTAYEQGYVWFEFTLPFSSDKASFDLNRMTWINNDDAAYKYTLTEENGVQTLRCARKLVPPEGATNAIPGGGEVPVAIKVKNMKHGERVTASASSWMDHSTREPQSIDLPPVTVSAALKLNIQLVGNNRSDVRGWFDFTTGDASAPNKSAGNVYGNLAEMGYIVSMYNDSEAKGMKGLAIPEGDITFDIELEHTYKNNNAAVSETLSGDYGILLWGNRTHEYSNAEPDGKWRTGDNLNDRFSNGRSDMGSSWSSYFPYSSTHATVNEAYKTILDATKNNTKNLGYYGQVWNSGQHTVTQNNNKLTVTIPGTAAAGVKAYEVNPDWFPAATSQTEGLSITDTNGAYYDIAQGVKNVAIFSTGMIGLVQPFGNPKDNTYLPAKYGGNAIDGSAVMTIKDVNLRASTGVQGPGQSLDAVSDNSNQMVQEDDSKTIGSALVPPGKYHSRVAYTTSASRSIGSDTLANVGNIVNGTDALPAGYQGAKSFIHWGVAGEASDITSTLTGVDSLMKFDPKGIEIQWDTLNNVSHSYYSQVYETWNDDPVWGTRLTDEARDAKWAETDFAKYKNAGGANGFLDDNLYTFYYAAKPDGSYWSSDEEQSRATFDDLVYYPSVQALEADGKVCVGIVLSFRGTPIEVSKQRDSNGQEDKVALVQYKAKSGTDVVNKTYQITQDSTYWQYGENKVDPPKTFAEWLASKQTYNEFFGGAKQQSDWDSVGDKTYGSADNTPAKLQQMLLSHEDPSMYYKKATYDKNGNYIPGTETYWWGDTLLITGYESKISKKTAQLSENSSKKYYFLDDGQTEVEYMLTPSFEGDGISGATTITLTDILPQGLTYIAESGRVGGTFDNESDSVSGGKKINPKITQNEDGSTTLVFKYKTSNIGGEQQPVYFRALIDPMTPNGTSYLNQVSIKTTEDMREPNSRYGNIATFGIQVGKTTSYAVNKKTDVIYKDVGEDIVWDISFANTSANVLTDKVMYDWMPSNDSSNPSKFDGTLKVKTIKFPADGDFDPANYELYYTTQPLASDEISSLAKADVVSSWTKATRSGDTWTLDKSVTAWALVGDMPANFQINGQLACETSNNAGGNVYINRAGIETSYIHSYVYVRNRAVNGVVWEDVNEDGKRDQGEPLIKDVIVELVDAQNQVVNNLNNKPARTTTDANGYYELNSLPAGDYKIAFRSNSGKVNLKYYDVTTYQADGVDTTINSDAEPTKNSSAEDAVVKDVNLPTLEKMIEDGVSMFSMDNLDMGVVPSTGDIEVTKTVVGGFPGDPLTFKVKVHLSDSTVNGKFGDMTFTNGDAEFDIQNGQTVQGIGLPSSATYTVSEIDVEDKYSVGISPSSGPIQVGTMTSINITNSRLTTDLTLKKTVTGNKKAEDIQKLFEFKVKVGSITGTFAGVNFNGGVATVKLRDGDVVTITGLPMLVDYEITEKDYSYEGYNLVDSTNTNGTLYQSTTSEFINSVDRYGTFKLTKNVTGAGVTDADRNTYFTGWVELADTSVSGTFGQFNFTNGKARFKIKHGETLTASDLPVTTVTVKEDSYTDQGFVTTYDKQVTRIKPNEEVAATITNTKETGSLKISKNITGTVNDSDKNEKFTVNISLVPAVTATYGGVKFNGGNATVEVSANQPVIIEGIPAGTTYTAYETPGAGWSKQGSGNATGKITADNQSDISFTNYSQKYGDLTVKKTFIGTPVGDDGTRKYSITVTLTDTNNNPLTGTVTYGDVTFTNGSAVLKLAPNESKTITKLPVGYNYSIQEEDVTNAGMTTTYSNKSGTIVSNTSVTAAAINQKSTGDLMIGKSLEGQVTSAERSKEFTFNVEFTPAVSFDAGIVQVNNGKASVKLKDGQTCKLINIPAGINYKVTEAPTGDAGITIDKDRTYKTEGVIKANTINGEAHFTNKVAKYGNFSVRKIVSGKALTDEDNSREYELNITLSGTGSDITGTYGDMTFKNGKATVMATPNKVYTAKDIPAGVKIDVSEKSYANKGFFTEIKNNGQTLAPNGTVDVQVVNTKATGKLTLTKRVTGRQTEIDASRVFWFNIDLSDKTFTGIIDGISFKNGHGRVKLAGGESREINDIPANLGYTITEDDYSSEKIIPTSKTGDKGTIEPNGDYAAIFTNDYRRYSDLEVTKSVTGNVPEDEKNKEFEMKITLSDKTINGKFGDMYFVNGVSTFALHKGETRKGTNLPAGVTYKVEENNYSAAGYTTNITNGEGTLPANSGVKCTVANMRNSGDLRITKTVAGGGDANKNFKFHVKVLNENINGKYGPANFVNGEADVTLKSGETAVIGGLPSMLSYIVTEDNYILDGYFTTYTASTGIIPMTGSVTAAFTNTLQVGQLNVGKTANGNDYHAGREWNFKVTLESPDPAFTGDKTYGGVNYTFKDGKLETTFKVKEGTTKSLSGIPEGFKYVVEELDRDTDKYGTTTTLDRGVIEKNKTILNQWINTRDTFGDLVLEKKASGDGVLDTKVFEFKVTLSDKTISNTYGDMKFEKGVATVYLKAGESKTAKGLPNGVTYTVEETNADAYTKTYTGKTGKIKGDSSVKATVLNAKTLPPITKTVNNKTHHDLAKRDEEVTYRIATRVPDGAQDFVITDTIVDELDVVNNSLNVTVDGKAVSDVIAAVESKTVRVRFTKELVDKYSEKDVVVTFKAKIISNDLSKYLDGEYIKVPNYAEYVVNDKISKKSEVVTITPPLPNPPIEKFVEAKKEHEMSSYDDKFHYEIKTQIPEDVLQFEVTDTLVDELEFAGEVAVSLDGHDQYITEEVDCNIDGQTITVNFPEKILKLYRTQGVAIVFDAKIKSDANVLTWLDSDGKIRIPNNAKYIINKTFKENKREKTSDTVKVIPPVDRPELSKAVNNKSHEDLNSYDEWFEYKITTTVPRGAHEFVIRDSFDSAFQLNPDTVKVLIDGEEIETDGLEISPISREDGDPVYFLTYTMDKDKLGAYFNKQLDIKVQAKIYDSCNVLLYQDEEGNIKIPNKATYEINNNIPGESNTVTVTPPVTEPPISKTVMDVEHFDLNQRYDTFSYQVRSEVVRGTGYMKLTDTLVPELELTGDLKAYVGTEPEQIEVPVEVSGNTVTVELREDIISQHYGKPILIEIGAKIREGVSLSKYVDDRGYVHVPNNAKYVLGNNVSKTSETVTVTPPVEDIPVEKFVNELKEDTLHTWDDAFTYKIDTKVPLDAATFEISDTLVEGLEFDMSSVMVRCEGASIAVKPLFDGNTVKLMFSDENLAYLRGKSLTLMFNAHIKSDADMSMYRESDGVIRIPNKATVLVNDSFEEVRVEKESDTVKVIPPAIRPDITKLVNDSEHYDLTDKNEVFEYTITTMIPRGAYGFVLEDTLVDELEFTGGFEVNPELDVKTENQTISVTIDDKQIELNKDKALTLKFKARIREGADISKYKTEDGKIKVPNMATYKLDEGFVVFEKDSNVVTVTPPEEEAPVPEKETPKPKETPVPEVKPVPAVQPVPQERVITKEGYSVITAKTGDTNNMPLIVGIALAAVAASVGALIYRKRKLD